jgi:hypothetical protein
VRTGEAGDVVVRVEWGRGRVLSEAFERNRLALTRLDGTHRSLAARFRKAAARVAALDRAELAS